MDAQAAFIQRNRQQRELADMKSLQDAVAVIQAQTRELNSAAAYNQRINVELAALKGRVAAAMPELRKRLYAPLWMIPAARGDPHQPVPNGLWLVASLVLIAAGVLVMVL